MANGNQNQNQKNVNGTEQQPAQQQNNAPVQPEPVAQQPAVVTEEKGGFGAWCKRNWKKLAVGVTSLAALGGSAFVAYKKGKAAGVMSVPVQQQDDDDYSLNPNE